MKVPLAVCPLSSLARTELPLVPAGVGKVQLNAPLGLAVNVPVVHAVIGTASKTSEDS